MSKSNTEILSFQDMNDIVKKLGGEVGALRFLKGETIVREPSSTDFVVWKTIRLGTGMKKDDFRKAIGFAGMRVDDGDQGKRDIITETAMLINEKEIEIDLALATGVQLGLGHHAHIVDIIERASRLGLEICPTEVGPQLRLQYLDQPRNECLQVPIGTIPKDGGRIETFVLAHYHKLRDCVDYDDVVLHKDSHWYKRSTPVIHGDPFVFVKPRKQERQ